MFILKQSESAAFNHNSLDGLRQNIESSIVIERTGDLRDALSRTHYALASSALEYSGQKRKRVDCDTAPRKLLQKAEDTRSGYPEQAMLIPLPPSTLIQSNSQQQLEVQTVVQDAGPSFCHDSKSTAETAPAKLFDTVLPNAQHISIHQTEHLPSSTREKQLEAVKEVSETTAIPTSKNSAIDPSTPSLTTSEPSPSPSPTQADAKPRPQPCRPRHTYPVPAHLESVRRALGPANWDEYLLLMEGLWTGEISGATFAARTKSICMVFNDAIRKQINNAIAMDMVVPLLESLMREAQGKREEARLETEG